MLTPLLDYLRTSTRQTRVRRAADAVGVTRVARDLYRRRLVAGGVYRTVLMGQPLAFAVQNLQELERIDNVCFERLFIERMLEHVPSEGVVWDVGANIGVISQILAAARPRLRIEAFEPEPRNAEHLRRNFALNRLESRCRVHADALSNQIGEGRLSVIGKTGDGHHTLDPERLAGGSSVPVRTFPGDYLVQSLETPGAIKIDVEGAEMLVLDGMRRMLAGGDVRHIFIELHESVIPLASGEADAGRLLEELGYRRTWEHPRGGELHCHYQYAGRAVHA